jgi:hypothetical protein
VSLQTFTDQHADHFISRPDPQREAEVIDLAQQAFRQAKVYRLFRHRFCCHCTGTTGIINVSHPTGTSISYISDVVNGSTSHSGYSP